MTPALEYDNNGNLIKETDPGAHRSILGEEMDRFSKRFRTNYYWLGRYCGNIGKNINMIAMPRVAMLATLLEQSNR